VLPPEFGALLAELNRDDLDFVVIGGVAVNLLGYERVTGDVDVLVPATRAQGAALRRLLTRLEATQPDGTALEDYLCDGDHHIRALTVHGLVDFIPEGEEPLSFESVRARADDDEVFGVLIRRVSLEHLVLLKQLAGRPRDREDLAALEQAYGTLPDSGSD